MLGDRAHPRRAGRTRGVRPRAVARGGRHRGDDPVVLRLRLRSPDGPPDDRGDDRVRRAGRRQRPPAVDGRRRSSGADGGGGRRSRRPAGVPPRQQRRRTASVADVGPRRPGDARRRGDPPGGVDRGLRRPFRHPLDRGRQRVPRAAGALRPQPGHRLRDGRRPPRRHRGQSAPATGGHARHHVLAQGRPLRVVLRCLQPAAGDPGRHVGLLPRQGHGVAGDDPPRRPARLRLRPGHRPPSRPDPAQVLWRGLHRHGLQGHGV